MNIYEHANTLLVTLADKLQGEIPPLTENAASVFTVGDIVVSCALAEEIDTLVVSAAFGRLPDGERRESALRELARGNFHWGGTDGGIIGLEEETGLLFLHRKFDLPVAKTADFVAAFARQIGLARYWAKTLADNDGRRIPSSALRA